MKGKKTIAVSGIVVMLVGLLAFVYYLLKSEKGKVYELETQIAELQVKEKRSAVLQSISRQMEQIAYQQKSISDEQREEALRQKREADEAKELAESQRHEADLQRQEADKQRQEAEVQRQEAERQRQGAEVQRRQAVNSKRIADTLSYIALGRSLASVSSMQLQAGNKELANLLAYASYVFTKRYMKDEDNLYHPSVIQALMDASQSKRGWSVHNGSLTGIDIKYGNDNYILTVSSYGEIFQHDKQGNQLHTKRLFSDKNYDFRNVYIDESERVYALSRSGHLVVIIDGKSTIYKLSDVVNPTMSVSLDENTLAILGENGAAFFDRNAHVQTGFKGFNFKVVSICRNNSDAMIFDDKGYVHIMQGKKELVDLKLHSGIKSGNVTAFAASRDSRLTAYGMNDGRIFLVDRTGVKKELVGHRSRISRLKFNDARLYSSSYDGTMNLWMCNAEKIEPMQLFRTDGWIMYFTTDSSQKRVWTGDQKGNLTEALISLPEMVKIIKSKLKRNLTHDEWNYYIGKDVPYETFLTEGKEVRQ